MMISLSKHESSALMGSEYLGVPVSWFSSSSIVCGVRIFNSSGFWR